MKRYTLLTLILLVSACAKDMEVSADNADGGLARVVISVPETRATSTDEQEDRINRIQAFVFDDKGNLEKNVSAASGSVSADIVPGTKTVYVFTNFKNDIPELSMSSLTGRETSLYENKVGNLLAGGSDVVEVVSGMNRIEIPVRRYAAKVVVNRITNSIMTAAGYQYPTIYIKSIYLANVVASYGITYTAGSSKTWLNQREYVSCSSDHLIYFASSSGLTLSYGSSLNSWQRFYCYENLSNVDKVGTPWSERGTRLIVEAAIGSSTGPVRYYNIFLGPLKAGYSYLVDELTLTREGSERPDSYASAQTFTVSEISNPSPSGSTSSVTINTTDGKAVAVPDRWDGQNSYSENL